MSATVAADLLFDPVVWRDHIMGYYKQKLLWGALGFRDNTLEQAPGTTITFPYFKTIGAMEEPTEAGSLSVDSLGDDKFSATVKEVGKAVGFKDKSLMKSAAGADKMISEAQRQMGVRAAEKIDNDIVAELKGAGNSTTGFLTTADGQYLGLERTYKGKINAFGDRQEEALAMVIHSRQLADLVANPAAQNLLRADQSGSLFAGVSGRVGSMLGMAVFVSDLCPYYNVGDPGHSGVGAEAEAVAYLLKREPFGVIVKKDFADLERDRDILARETVMSMTAWYAVKSFHAKSSTDDKRVATLQTKVSSL